MTDRALLELAAKAAGMKIDTHYVDGGASVWTGEPRNSDWMPNWNPLADDGDAQRLVVKLGLAVSVEYQVGSTAVLWGPPMGSIREQHSADPFAATRRAITCAAAEIGRAIS